MNVIPALALVVLLAQNPVPPAAKAERLDSRWIQGIGTVTLATPGGNELSIEIRDEAGSTSTRTLALDLPDPAARIVEAHATSFLAQQELLVGLAVQAGRTTSYHALILFQLADPPKHADTGAATCQAGKRRWLLTKPIFTSSGAPYRIVDVHNPAGDGIEITFRRGYAEPLARDGKPRVDEKIYVNVCPGSDDPMVFGSLLTVSATGTAR